MIIEVVTWADNIKILRANALNSDKLILPGSQFFRVPDISSELQRLRVSACHDFRLYDQ